MKPGDVYSGEGLFLVLSADPLHVVNLFDWCSVISSDALRAATLLTPEDADERLNRWEHSCVERRIAARLSHERAAVAVGNVMLYRRLIGVLRGGD
jgi:hypothetical protein